MKTAVTYVGAFLLTLILIGLTIFFFFPGIMVQLNHLQVADSAGLEKRKVVIDGYEVNYYISKKMDHAETLLLLHGFGDDKTCFLQAVPYLFDHFNLVLPDLQGHGENERDSTCNVTIHGQSEFLCHFLLDIGLEKVHVAGSSMGGHIAAVFALNNPEMAESLILVNASGLKLDDRVVYTKMKKLKTKEELMALMNKIFYKTPEIPGPMADFMIEKLNNDSAFKNEIILPAIKNGAYYNLKDKVQSIKARTLVLWGTKDRIVPANVAQYYSDSIPHAKLQPIKNAGHAAQYEKAEEVAEAMVSFISD